MLNRWEREDARRLLCAVPSTVVSPTQRHWSHLLVSEGGSGEATEGERKEVRGAMRSVRNQNHFTEKEAQESALRQTPSQSRVQINQCPTG